MHPDSSAGVSGNVPHQGPIRGSRETTLLTRSRGGNSGPARWGRPPGQPISRPVRRAVYGQKDLHAGAVDARSSVGLLASGAFQDVPCSAVAAGEETLGQGAMSLVSTGHDETVEQARQPFSIFGLACSVLVGAAVLLMDELCATPGAERPDKCRNVGKYGLGGAGILCAFI